MKKQKVEVYRNDFFPSSNRIRTKQKLFSEWKYHCRPANEFIIFKNMNFSIWGWKLEYYDPDRNEFIKTCFNSLKSQLHTIIGIITSLYQHGWVCVCEAWLPMLLDWIEQMLMLGDDWWQLLFSQYCSKAGCLMLQYISLLAQLCELVGSPCCTLCIAQCAH